MLDMISVLLNLLRLDLWPKMWSILENVPCALEKKVYSFAFGWNVLKISMRSISSNVSFKTCVSLLIFCFNDLSIGVQFSSVAQSCLTLCNPMNCSISGLLVHHQLPEFTQTHVHQIGDAIQPSHPLLSPLLLPPTPPSIRVFSNESTLCMRWPKYWSFHLSISPSSEHPGLVSFRIDWLDLLAVQGTWKSMF